jgi:predicted nucleic acid-binding protein
MYLLDTNVISELRKTKAGKADPKVVAWAERVPTPSLFLSVITLLGKVQKISPTTPDSHTAQRVSGRAD